MLRKRKTILNGAASLLALSLLACSGEDGADGVDGTNGEDGVDGEDGADGADGADGKDGADGEDGADGKDGEDGEDGEKGDKGDPGEKGETGDMGVPGPDGKNSLIVQTVLEPGDPTHCVAGGLQIETGLDADENGTLDASEVTMTNYVCNAPSLYNFNRIASFLSCTQDDPTCDSGAETSAEIVSATDDGMTLVYSDSPAERIGFVDISDPSAPVADGAVDLSGEPTSVSVVGNYALVGINTSPDFVSPSGELAIIDIENRVEVHSIDLGGQPDSVAISPDGSYAVIAIENERDEDIEVGGVEGDLPQLPAGYAVVVDISGIPQTWTTTMVSAADLLGGTVGYAPTDPEAEFVDINSDNVAVVTMQENNAIALIDLASKTVLNSFSAGTVDLDQIDIDEEDVISMTSSLTEVPREPDGVAWIGTEYFATADEGDLFGGSRGFTIFNTAGDIVFTSGNSMDHLTAKFGHYPENRSGNKGNEPENVEYGEYGGEKFLFVNSERSSLVFVYDVADPTNPVFRQVLPAGVGPEGGLALPERDLLVVASEVDDRGDKIRSVLNIYEYDNEMPSYPTIQSLSREDGTPIPWSAMSGLAASNTQSGVLYSVEDSAYAMSRFFTIDASVSPALLVAETRIVDSNDVFAALPTVDVDDSYENDHPDRIETFDDLDLAALINDDKTINIDPEGISVAADGGFWVVSEGNGTIGDAGRPINSLNFLFKLDSAGVIEEVVTLPDAVNEAQLRFGFEGVAEYDGKVYVAFQRVWDGDSGVRIGIYDITAETWEFVFYTLDAVESQNGGWVGLSDITSLGDGTFLIVERDNQGGPDAAIKRLYTVDLNGASDGDTVTKTFVRDLLPDLTKTGGLTTEKVEGSAYDASGNVWIINDNDGVDDNSGETQLMNLGSVL